VRGGEIPALQGQPSLQAEGQGMVSRLKKGPC
jgi:hypothetical protein